MNEIMEDKKKRLIDAFGVDTETNRYCLSPRPIRDVLCSLPHNHTWSNYHSGPEIKTGIMFYWLVS